MMERQRMEKNLWSVRFAAGWLLVGLLSGVGWWTTPGQAQDAGEWEIHTKDGVVERRTASQPQVVDVGLPVKVDVPSAVLGSGPGKPIEVERVMSKGIGGRPGQDSFWGIGDIVEDKQGTIWVDADEGLCRFDGREWTMYTQQDGLPESISDLEVDAQGQLWMAGKGGVVQFDGERWIQHRLGIDTEAVAVGPKGEVWTGGARYTGRVGTDNKELYDPMLCRFDGTDWWEFGSEDGLPLNGFVTHLDVDSKGTVWFAIFWLGQLDYRLLSFDDTQFVGYRMEYGAHVVYVDSKDRAWISSRGIIVNEGQKWKRYNDVGDVFGGMHDIIEDSLGRFWIGIGSKIGVLEGTRWSYYNFLDGLDIYPQKILVDRQGNIWLDGNNQLIKWRPTGLPTPVKERPPFSPTGFQLYPNYPNPFNRQTSVAFQLPDHESLSLQVLNLSGQVVGTLLEGTFDAGMHRTTWDGRDVRNQAVSSGLYFYRLALRDRVAVGKMTLAK